jgi:hypothetical protein
MKAIIPDNFITSAHLRKYPPAHYGLTTFNVDHALYLLTQLTLAPAQDQQLLDNIDLEHNFIPLHAKLLQAKVHNYKSYLSYFMKTYVIESDNRYVREIDRPGEGKSIGYRFTSDYYFADLQTVEYGQAWLNILKKKQRQKYNELKKEYNHLVKWLWPTCDIQIDFKSAQQWLTLRKKAQMSYPELRSRELNRKKHIVEIKNPITQFKFAKANILSLYIGDTHCSVDKTTFRMHSVLTNMSSIMRNFLTYKGQSLVSIDIKNCQPYLITALLNQDIYSTQRRGINLSNLNPELYARFKHNLPPVNTLKELMMNEDVYLYKSLVSNVDNNPLDLYEYMLKECEKNSIRYDNRNAIKVGMYEVLFTANRYGTPIKKLFKKLFPTIDQLCKAIKESNKANLACLLQSIESHIVLKVITKRLAREEPKAPIFTIHDSVVTTQSYANKLKTIMIEELTILTGLPPKLKKEIWTPEAVDWNIYRV